MRLALLNSIEKETYGGMEEWLRIVGQGLARRNHQVTFIGREQSEFLRRCQTDDANVRFLPIKISGDFNPATISKIHSYLNDNNIDCLTVNFNKDIRLGGLAARLHGSCRVVWSVGLDITKDSFAHKFFTPKLIDKVIVPSQSLKNEITRLGYITPEIVDIIPIGIEDANLKESKEQYRSKLLRRYNLPNNAIISVTSGRFVNQKGHDVLVEAIPEIAARYPNFRFLFLGDGPNKKQLTEQIEKLKLSKYVVLTGMLDSVGELLAGADIMIHPSRFEPFGIAVLEGMRAGLPVVASRVGGIPEVVAENENALLVEPEKPGLLTKAVLSLLENTNNMTDYGTAGRKRFEQNFQYEQMLDRIEQTLTTVISSGKVQS